MKRDINELERWLDEHPVLATLNGIGAAILILELEVLLHHLSGGVTKCVPWFGC